MLQVTIGFAQYNCSCLSYPSTESNTPLIIGLVVGLGGLCLLIIIVVAVVVKCRSNIERRKLTQAKVESPVKAGADPYSHALPAVYSENFYETIDDSCLQY